MLLFLVALQTASGALSCSDWVPKRLCNGSLLKTTTSVSSQSECADWCGKVSGAKCCDWRSTDNYCRTKTGVVQKNGDIPWEATACTVPAPTPDPTPAPTPAPVPARACSSDFKRFRRCNGTYFENGPVESATECAEKCEQVGATCCLWLPLGKGCKPNTGSSYHSPLSHHYAIDCTGPLPTLQPTEAPTAVSCDNHGAAVAFDKDCGVETGKWTSVGTTVGKQMSLRAGMTIDPQDGPLFEESRGRGVNYNISPSQVPEITLELWFKVTDKPSGSKCWIIGHDNGGYDRAINLCDSRYGGVAAANGSTWKSTLGYPDEDKWYHVVATFKNGASDNVVYLQEAGGELRSNTFKANNGNGLSSFTVGGLNNFSRHHVHAYIPVVRVFERRLSEEEVQGLYEADLYRLTGECTVGSYRGENDECLPKRTHCMAGEGFVAGADEVKDRDDTQCTACSLEEFSDGHSACAPKANDCEKGSYMDYGSSTQEDDHSCPACEDGSFSDEDGALECLPQVAQEECEAGTRYIAPLDATEKGACKPCEAGTFNELSGLDMCLEMTDCAPWTVKIEGKATADRECTVCEDHGTGDACLGVTGEDGLNACEWSPFVTLCYPVDHCTRWDGKKRKCEDEEGCTYEEASGLCQETVEEEDIHENVTWDLLTRLTALEEQFKQSKVDLESAVEDLGKQIEDHDTANNTADEALKKTMVENKAAIEKSLKTTDDALTKTIAENKTAIELKLKTTAAGLEKELGDADDVIKGTLASAKAELAARDDGLEKNLGDNKTAITGALKKHEAEEKAARESAVEDLEKDIDTADEALKKKMGENKAAIEQSLKATDDALTKSIAENRTAIDLKIKNNHEEVKKTMGENKAAIEQSLKATGDSLTKTIAENKTAIELKLKTTAAGLEKELGDADAVIKGTLASAKAELAARDDGLEKNLGEHKTAITGALKTAVDNASKAREDNDSAIRDLVKANKKAGDDALTAKDEALRKALKDGDDAVQALVTTNKDSISAIEADYLTAAEVGTSVLDTSFSVSCEAPVYGAVRSRRGCQCVCKKREGGRCDEATNPCQRDPDNVGSVKLSMASEDASVCFLTHVRSHNAHSSHDTTCAVTTIEGKWYLHGSASDSNDHVECSARCMTFT